MEKTIEEITAAVLAYCETACPQSTNGFWHSISASIKLMHHPSELHRWSLDFFDGDGTNEWLCVLCWIGEDSSTEEMNTAYHLLGLDKRDALEAERGKSAKLVQALTKIRKMRKTDRYWDGESMTKIAALALEAYKEGKKDEN